MSNSVVSNRSDFAIVVPSFLDDYGLDIKIPSWVLIRDTQSEVSAPVGQLATEELKPSRAETSIVEQMSLL